MTPIIHLLYATVDGQTLKIAQHMASFWEKSGDAYELHNLALGAPDPSSWPQETPVVVMAPIRHGRHLPAAECFLQKNKKTLNNQQLVMASINLTSRKPEKSEPHTNAYYGKWIKRHGLKPVLGAVLAGRLEYRLYRPWEKWMIRLIMHLTGGPTDFDAVIEYTPWDKVDSLASQIAALAKGEKTA